MATKSFLKALCASLSVTVITATTALPAFAEGDATAASTSGSLAGMVIPLALVFVVMYFLMIRPQKKKEKETKAMQSGVEIGDEIVTIGGIVGMVVRVGDDNVVIETGGEKNKMRIKLWAISENTTAKEKAEEAAKAMKKSKVTPAKGNEEKE